MSNYELRAIRLDITGFAVDVDTLKNRIIRLKDKTANGCESVGKDPADSVEYNALSFMETELEEIYNKLIGASRVPYFIKKEEEEE